MRTIYEDHYTLFKHDLNNRFTCFYCGAAAISLDHQPPISRVSDYQSLNLFREEYIKVICCNECNSLLSNKLHESLIDREMDLKIILENRYKKLVVSPVWDEKDIMKKGRNLRSYIQEKEQKRKEIIKRLDYGIGINAYIDSIENKDRYAI